MELGLLLLREEACAPRMGYDKNFFLQQPFLPDATKQRGFFVIGLQLFHICFVYMF